MPSQSPPPNPKGKQHRGTRANCSAGTRGAQYGEAFEIVKAIQELRAAQKQDALFGQELAGLRTTWKAKRNFMKLLATLG
jgi:hypothetical protein